MQFSIRTVLFVAVWISGLPAASLAALPAVTITTSVPTRDGVVSFKFFKCADSECKHGTIAECTIPIPAGIPAALKAALIADVLDNPVATPKPPGGCGLTAAVAGNVITVTYPPDGTECTKATDSTGEYMHVANGSSVLPVSYVSNFRLSGSALGGVATIGEDGNSRSVPTVFGETPASIYSAWAAAFGEGTVGPDGFTLPIRSGVTRSFDFEITDPGLSIAVRQDRLPPGVPALSVWSLLALVLLMMSGGVVLVRNRAVTRTRA